MKLLKTIKRELLMRAPEGRYRGNAIILELQPGDVLMFRIKGTQQRCEVSLAHCYNLAQKLTYDKQHAQAMHEYKLKQSRGERPRKPVKPHLFLNSKIYR